MCINITFYCILIHFDLWILFIFMLCFGFGFRMVFLTKRFSYHCWQHITLYWYLFRWKSKKGTFKSWDQSERNSSVCRLDLYFVLFCCVFFLVTMQSKVIYTVKIVFRYENIGISWICFEHFKYYAILTTKSIAAWKSSTLNIVCCGYYAMHNNIKIEFVILHFIK